MTIAHIHVICNPQQGKSALDIAVEKGLNEIIEVIKFYQSKVRCASAIR